MKQFDHRGFDALNASHNGADRAIRKDNKYKVGEYEDDNNLHQRPYSEDGNEDDDARH